MSQLAPIAEKLMDEALAAFRSIDRQRQDEARQITAALLAAVRTWKDSRADVRRLREEAARMVSESLKLEDAAEQEFSDAITRIERALAVLGPPEASARLAAE